MEEYPSPADREDAIHWVTVYDELIATCRLVLAEDARGRNSLARRIVEFEERRAFWLKLLRE